MVERRGQQAINICLHCALDDCNELDPHCPFGQKKREVHTRAARKYVSNNRDKVNAFRREWYKTPTGRESVKRSVAKINEKKTRHNSSSKAEAAG